MTSAEFDERLESFDRLFNEWHDWEHKFAWFPTKVDNRLIWLKKYYERRPLFFPDSRCERVLTVLDMLK